MTLVTSRRVIIRRARKIIRNIIHTEIDICTAMYRSRKSIYTRRIYSSREYIFQRARDNGSCVTQRIPRGKPLNHIAFPFFIPALKVPRTDRA